MLIIRQSSVGSWHVIHEWHDTYLYLSCWLEDNLLSVPETCDPWMAWYIPVLIMYRRLSSSQHDKYRYVSCHSWITCQEPTEDCLLVNMISTGMYHAIHGSHVRNRQKIVFDYQTIFCRFLTCDPWMTWYIHVLIMLIIRQSSVGSWHVIHEYRKKIFL
jgi:hypothetical protein